MTIIEHQNQHLFEEAKVLRSLHMFSWLHIKLAQ